MAGLFFCLASAEGAGLLFCPAAIQTHTSIYSAFCTVHAVIPPTPQNSAHGFAGAFPAICRVLLLLCGGCIHLHCTACDTLERITALQHLQHIQDTSATPDAVQLSTAALLYNKVYKDTTYCRPCQPGGLQSCTGSAVRTGTLAPSTRRGSPAAGARRAARNH